MVYDDFNYCGKALALGPGCLVLTFFVVSNNRCRKCICTFKCQKVQKFKRTYSGKGMATVAVSINAE
eukprot:4843167-Amphidinium_carterae.1